MTISVASNVTKFLELKTRDIVVPIVETDEVLNRSFVVSESARLFFLGLGLSWTLTGGELCNGSTRQVDPSYSKYKKNFQENHSLFIAPYGREGRLQVSFKYYNEPFSFKLIFFNIILVKIDQNAPKILCFLPFLGIKSENYVLARKTKCVCLQKMHL